MRRQIFRRWILALFVAPLFLAACGGKGAVTTEEASEAASAPVSTPLQTAPAPDPGPEKTGGFEGQVVEGARCSPETLEPLSEHLDASHALALAEARVAQTLAALPSGRWLVARYALIAGHRIPVLALGETGAFTVWALPKWFPPASGASPGPGGLRHSWPCA